LSHNKLTSFPTALLGLKQLNLVDLSANSIAALPQGITSSRPPNSFSTRTRLAY
jgi:Leucine-rich repeat (LRR) protein